MDDRNDYALKRCIEQIQAHATRLADEARTNGPADDPFVRGLDQGYHDAFGIVARMLANAAEADAAYSRIGA